MLTHTARSLNTAQRVSTHSTELYGVDADVVARADPVRREMVRQPVGAGLHLGVGPALPLGDEVLAGPEVIDGVLEEVGEVELHRAALYGSP